MIAALIGLTCSAMASDHQRPACSLSGCKHFFSYPLVSDTEDSLGHVSFHKCGGHVLIILWSYDGQCDLGHHAMNSSRAFLVTTVGENEVVIHYPGERPSTRNLAAVVKKPVDFRRLEIVRAWMPDTQNWVFEEVSPDTVPSSLHFD